MILGKPLYQQLKPDNGIMIANLNTELKDKIGSILFTSVGVDLWMGVFDIVNDKRIVNIE